MPRPFTPSLDRRFRPGLGKVSFLSNLCPLSFSRLTFIHRPAPTLSGLLPTALSPSAATLMDLPASVAYKRLTAWLNPLDAIFTKNRGATQRATHTSTFQRMGRTLAGPIAAKRPWCNNERRPRISSTSGETTPLPPVSKDTERTSGTVLRRSRSNPDSVRVASRSLCDRTRKKAWVHRSNVGPQQGGSSNSSVQDGECACIR